MLYVEGEELLRNFRCDENPLDIFDGFASYRGNLIRSCRRWFGQGPEKYGDWLNSHVILSGRELDYGDDPRIFTLQGKICISANIFSPGFGFRNHLLEIQPDGSWERYFLMVPPDVVTGKNWSPFEFPDGVLGFIHSFSPLRILREVRREKGIILLSSIEAEGIPAEPGDAHGFPAHRGGSNGLRLGRHIVGIGHTTRVARQPDGGLVYSPGCYYERNEQLIHRPFLWKLCLPTLTLECTEIEYKWDPRFWVIDPTSIVPSASPGKFSFFTTEVERSFIDPTSAGRVMRYDFSINLNSK